MKHTRIFLFLMILTLLALTGCNQGKIKQMEGQVATLEANVQGVTEAGTAAATEAAATLQAVTDEKDALITAGQTVVETVTAERDAAQTSVTTLTTDLETVTAERDAAQASVTTLTTDLETVTAERDAAQASVTTLTTDLETVTAERDAAQASVTTLTTDLETVTAERDAAQASVTTLTTDLETVTAERDAAQASVTTLTTDLETVTAERDAAQASVTTLTTDLETVTAERDAAQASVTALTTELETVTAERDALLEQLQAPASEVDNTAEILPEETEEGNAGDNGDDITDTEPADSENEESAPEEVLYYGEVVVRNHHGTALQESPSLHSQVLAKIPNHTILASKGETVFAERTTWVKVITVEGLEGWIPAAHFHIHPDLQFPDMEPETAGPDNAEDTADLLPAPKPETKEEDFLGEWQAIFEITGGEKHPLDDGDRNIHFSINQLWLDCTIDGVTTNFNTYFVSEGKLIFFDMGREFELTLLADGTIRCRIDSGEDLVREFLLSQDQQDLL